MVKLRKLVVSGLFLVSFFSLAFATEYTWTAASNGIWENQANWNDGVSGYPDDSADRAEFTSYVSSTNCSTTGPLTIGKLLMTNRYSGTIALGGSLTVDDAVDDGDLIVDAGTFSAVSYDVTVDRSLTVGNDGVFNAGSGNLLAGSGKTTTATGRSGLGVWGETAFFNGGSGNHTFSAIYPALGTCILTSGTTTLDSYEGSDSDIWTFGTESEDITFSHGNGTIVFTGATNQILYDGYNAAPTLNNVVINKTGGSIQFYNDYGFNLNIDGNLTVLAGEFDTAENTSGKSWNITVNGHTDVFGTLRGRAGDHNFSTLVIDSRGVYSATTGTTTVEYLEKYGEFIHNNGTLVIDGGKLTLSNFNLYYLDAINAANVSLLNVDAHSTDASDTSVIYRTWYLRANVTDTFGNPVTNPAITAIDQQSVSYPLTNSVFRDLQEYEQTASTVAYQSPYTVIASAPQYSTQSKTVNLTSSQTVDLQLVEEKELTTKLSGEFDYNLLEQIKVKLAVLVKDAATGEPVSNANVNITVYAPNGIIAFSGANLAENISGTGIYVLESNKIICQTVDPKGKECTVANYVKGVYVVHAMASYEGGSVATDMIELHIDPPGEPSFGVTAVDLAAGALLLVGAIGYLVYQRRK